MTHTVTDAESAIARHPDDLMQLCMATDLLIELDDPRGEDFAACLAGVITAEEVMRRHPADVSAMFIAAWWLGGYRGCQLCAGSAAFNCGACGCNASSGGRAEALRLLAECGKVGEPGFGYDDVLGHEPDSPCVVASHWWYDSNLGVNCPGWADPVSERLALLDAYAKVDPDTRRRWADETRALTPREDVTT